MSRNIIIHVCILGAIGIAGATLLIIPAYKKYTEERAVRSFDAQMKASTSFPGQVSLYATLLKTVGPSRAQDELFAVMPSNPRTHMINHESGTFLYQTEGLTGIQQCKNYFNGGCYHGFVEAYLLDHGLGAMGILMAACRDGRTLAQSRECNHGLGHAFLAMAGYDKLPTAIHMCEETLASSTEAISDCFDGIFMENNFGGFNVPPLGRWYKASDPLYPCDDPRVASDKLAHDSCWFMQSQATLNVHMYPQFGGDLTKASAYCATIPAGGDRITCVEGLYRQIQSIAGGDVAKAKTLCAQVDPNTVSACLSTIAESSYAFGDQSMALSICGNLTSLKDECYQSLFERITSTAYWHKSEQLAACGNITDSTYRQKCTTYVENDTSPN